ncbi:variant erythrocyte surface antigen-1 family protein [Babesia caballi]|uniref:Variant erythrocyte surface antigen-1 family protein n=1 Tax=Babesia caballi TaxID=5871 RepID=A0AAV4LRD4_BABCB|nr:variant erythrocyte surface antigen-1 family protein [Babesia caballi]
MKPLTCELQCFCVTIRYPFIRLCRPLLDCPSNLKEAIDWILRVTGKDGGGGTGNEQKLARAITGLPDFTAAINAARKKLNESGGYVSQALQKLTESTTLGPIITKLADGLKAFIGYGGSNGIAMVIDPLQQLRKGVLMFLSEVIIKLASRSNLTAVINNNEVNNAINKAFNGKDNVSFDDAIAKVREVKESGGQKIPDIVSALKNVDTLKSAGDVNGLAKGFKQYLTQLLTAISSHAPSQVGSLKNSLPALVEAYGNRSDIGGQMKTIESENNKINRNGSRNVGEILGSAVYYGTESLLNQLRKDGYKSSYQPTLNWDSDDNKKQIAQIFLGCLPLYYYWLTYLYWKCKQARDKGGWEKMAFNGAGGPALISFMVGQGYDRAHFNRQSKASAIAQLLEALGMSSTATATSNVKSHPDLLNELNNSLHEVIGSSASNLNNHSLSALFHLCRCYFTGKQIMNSNNPKIERRAPSAIREMLYWLSGLHFSPHHSSIEKEIDAFISHDQGLPVADSGITSSNNIITQSQMKGFLLSSCLSAPGVLGAIQGDAADSEEPEGEPWLYSLFSNNMNLQYPSGSALFNTLANYAYALQFQLYFLYRQCQNNYSYTCGWNECRYGSGVAAAGLTSHLCPKGCSQRNGGDEHNRGDHSRCRHADCSGQSPLQAFLTDNLKGFCRQQPGTSNHLTECSDRSMCHVPMGFAGKLRTGAGGGLNIAYALNPFCGGPSDPLRQLSEKLSCLTKRTPRTLGDVFGFHLQLVGQLFDGRYTMVNLLTRLLDSLDLSKVIKNTSSDLSVIIGAMYDYIVEHRSQFKPLTSTPSGLSRSFEAIVDNLSFWFQLFMVDGLKELPLTLFDLRQHCHNLKKEQNDGKIYHYGPGGEKQCDHSSSNSPGDLWSLYYPVGDSSSQDFDRRNVCSEIRSHLFLVGPLLSRRLTKRFPRNA